MRRWGWTLALLVPSLWAQNAVWIDLSGEWRKSADDRPEYAQPEFDDRAMGMVRLPWTASQRDGGTFWLRRSVAIPAGTDRSKLAVTLGPVRDVYELYANGVLIGQTGPFGDDKLAQVAYSRTIPVPAKVAAAAETLQLAIRTRRAIKRAQSSNIFRGGTYVITYAEHAPRQDGQHLINEQRLTYFSQRLIGIVLVGFALLIWLFWLAERERMDLFWLGMLLASRGTVDQALHSILSMNSFPLSGPSLLDLATATTLGALVELVMATVAIQIGWFRLILWIPCLWLGVYGNFPQNAAMFDSLALAILLYGRWRNKPGREHPMVRSLITLCLVMLTVTQFSAAQDSGGRLFPAYFEIGQQLYSFQSTTFLVLAIVLTMFSLGRLLGDRIEKQRLANELEAARAVQQMLVADRETRTNEFEVQTVYEPAGEVGGDFCWTRVAADGSLLVVVGDVSGKGLRAAMQASVSVGILRNERSASPAAVLAALNASLVGHTQGGFVTAVVARFDADGRMTVASAGHPAPFLAGVEIEMEGGLPLGITREAEYVEREVTARAGEQAVLVSDGVVEAENSNRELFGFERTKSVSGKAAGEIAAAAQAWGQNDDITVVTVRRAG